ncbi:DUF1385 domain-containing protein [Caproiciproducens sp. LBM24188]|nr:DUF1385 domain-containing protein [Oscillospiraceae bacterium]HHV31236.1 DUF1385 domain-containing protein [Clostridiales bacterium]
MAREQTKCITSIGGQALVEGIMMRGPKKTEVAVRQSDGTISLQQMETQPLGAKYPFLKWPFLRGIAALVDSLGAGYKALAYSVEKSGLEEDEEPSKFDRWVQEKFGDKMMGAIMTASTILGVLLAIVLFFALPTVLFNLVRDYISGPAINVWRSPVEGIMRILIFLIYIILVSRMPEIHRLFEYHGAEHKTIFCYENNEELTVENVRRHSRFHPRCGTSFIVIMLILGILIGFFIPFSNPVLRTVVKLLCIPIVVGLGYEMIRFCGRNDNWLTHIVSAPGMWVQHITTKEPDDSMIEVAIAAMQEVIPENGEDKIVL